MAFHNFNLFAYSIGINSIVHSFVFVELKSGSPFFVREGRLGHFLGVNCIIFWAKSSIFNDCIKVHFYTILG